MQELEKSFVVTRTDAVNRHLTIVEVDKKGEFMFAWRKDLDPKEPEKLPEVFLGIANSKTPDGKTYRACFEVAVTQQPGDDEPKKMWVELQNQKPTINYFNGFLTYALTPDRM